MRYRLRSHRNALTIIPAEAKTQWNELLKTIEDISDEELIREFEAQQGKGKSISKAINTLLKKSLVARHWKAEAPIFQDSEYEGDRWRLDFAKGKVSVEVAFNHGEAAAWNLLKPVLASELNHIKKAIQTEFGVVICATEEMRVAGGFDSAVGTLEKYESYLIPLRQPLSVPLMLIGLEPPQTFRVVHRKEGGKSVGAIRRI